MNRSGSVRELIKPMAPGFVREGIWKLRTYRELFRFAVKQRRLDFSIGDEPWLDEDSGAVFLRMLEGCRSYLEYGSGGSTVLAAKLGKPFISVDTDRHFLRAVRMKIGVLAPDQRLEHGNIGWTKQYGCPLFAKPHVRRQKKWRAYAELPWQFVESGLLPDLVMVDGRFRVAAALASCIRLVNAPESRILVDDYVTRPYYHTIEKYAQLVGTGGRMAIFRPPSSYCAGIRKALDEYSLDWR